MKQIISVIVFSLLLGAGNAGYAQWNNGSGTLSGNSDKEIKWNRTIADLGEVEYGSETKVSYQLTNVSGKPVLITNAQGSCGCTHIDYPRKPIAPNETITIIVTYEADDVGVFSKTVNLTMNIQKSRQTLYIKGVVKG